MKCLKSIFELFLNMAHKHNRNPFENDLYQNNFLLGVPLLNGIQTTKYIREMFVWAPVENKISN